MNYFDRKHSLSELASLLFVLCVAASCRHEPSVIPAEEVADNFPPEIGRIIKANCATAGCHNAASYEVSGGGLLMDSWQHLFDGGAHGAAIVPFSPENSSLLFFTNSYPDLGPVPQDSSMKMPLYRSPISREDYIMLRDWVANGAADKNGNIPFASNAANRQKIYVAHQGCDYVTVIDAEKRVVMRTIPIGNVPTIESAYALQVASDGFVYVTLWASQHIIKIDSRTDSVVDEIDFGSPNSTMLHTLPNGTDALVTNWFSNALVRLNISTGQITGTYGSGQFSSPHGIAHSRNSDTFFVTELAGNIVYKIAAASSTINKVSIDGNTPTTSGSVPGAYHIVMAPDYSKYFVTCENSNEVRVIDAKTDAIRAVIPVGKTPRQMAISNTSPYLFVACQEQQNNSSIYKGVVYIIDYNTHSVVRVIGDRYYMPHGLTVDDKNGMLYVFSRNIDPNGPVPHHNSSVCDGRSGYYSVYNFKALQPVNNRRYEVTVDPYSADIRFKQ